MQSKQDDIFEELHALIRQIYCCLTLTAMKRSLTEEEMWVLERACRLA